MCLTDWLRRVGDDIHSIALSLKQLAELFPEPHSLAATHSEPIPEENIMQKPRTLGIARGAKARAASGPAGDKDTVTISILDQQGKPFPGAGVTIQATSSDPTILTTDAPSGLTYGEHFLAAGSVTVEIVATFPDGTVLEETDSVSVTGVPGSLVATHSLPVVGP